MLGSLGHRVRSAALDFASWGPSAGVLLLLATVAGASCSPILAGARHSRRSGSRTSALLVRRLRLSHVLAHWVNDGLLTIFFLVVGLEIKREFTVGHLASRRSAALPVAAAIGGMVAPAVLYFSDASRTVPWSHGWGVPMATDTAFAVALIVMMGEPRADRAAHLPDRRRHRRRHRRDRRRGGRSIRAICSLDYLAGAAATHGRAGAAQPLRMSIGCRPIRCSGSRSGPASTPAACTPRWPA